MKALNKNKFHAFKVTINRELTGEDFVKKILFSDEWQFSNDGKVIRHNSHYWSDHNSHWTMDGHTQRRWNINVWCGIIDEYIIGPYFFEDNFNCISNFEWTRCFDESCAWCSEEWNVVPVGWSSFVGLFKRQGIHYSPS